MVGSREEVLAAAKVATVEQLITEVASGGLLMVPQREAVLVADLTVDSALVEELPEQELA